MSYQPSAIEPRWQAWWEEHRTFVATEDRSKPKFYVLGMFPYPSGRGLHVGHPATYLPADIVARLRRAQGYSVLHAMGWDAFGLPAEQRAIDEGIAPQVSTAEAIENFRRQLRLIGLSYDWTREVSTADPAYYKWTQYIFTLLYRQGHVRRENMVVNWCPALGTVLANDEVIDGRSERGGHPIERVTMRQWTLRITSFADRLLEGHDRIDWPAATKEHQRTWIGRSDGAEIAFALADGGERLRVFTTRPETIFGATYLVLAPEHPSVDAIVTPARRAEVDAYRRDTLAMSDIERQRQKTGIDTGAVAINPATGAAIPIWIANYVIAGYGTGAIMAVPAHDERDRDFAQLAGLPIVEVIEHGVLVRSGELDGTAIADDHAKRAAIRWLEERGHARAVVTYKMRDWVFARQRYWGEPIPLLEDEHGEVVRALELAELPVVLPEVASYAPSGSGRSPLAAARDWVEVDDPVTGRRLHREVDTMPGSAASSWYFLRFCDPHNPDELCARDRSDYWMPVDLYIGGTEHAVGHLLYARMWQKALHDAGLVRDDEPFASLRHNGMILGATYYDPDGRVVPHDEVEERGERLVRRGTDTPLVRASEKMSKRKGNVVNPDSVAAEYGADAMRVYLCFLGPVKDDKTWSPRGLAAQRSWLDRVWALVFDGTDAPRAADVVPTEAELRVIHRAIDKVTHDIERLQLNTAISALHIATRDLAALGARARGVLEPLVQLVQPFAPHLAEELWSAGLGHAGGIAFVPWPVADPRYVRDDDVEIGVQVNGKTRGSITIARDADQVAALAAARASAALAPYVGDRPVVQVIYKPGRILSVVI